MNHSINRRTFLSHLGLGLSGSLLSTGVWADLAGTKDRHLSLRNLHTNESLTVTYCRNGQYDSGALYDINQVLRDHRTNDSHQMSLGLLDTLSLLQASCGANKEMHIISGYRSPKSNEHLRSNSQGVAKRSLHMTGQAADIRIPGIDIEELRKSAAKLKAGGVGFYPKSGFIHLDVGRVRYWS